MKSTSIREAQHHLGAILDRVARGEPTLLTRHGRVIAKIIPATEEPEAPVEWPDFAARLQRRFPDGPPRGKPASKIILDDREERL